MRSVFALELERALRGETGAEWVSRGTSLGTLHRSWVDLRLALGATDRTVFETTEQCEEYAVAGYDVSLGEEDVPKTETPLLHRQAQHVRRALGIVRRYLAESGEKQEERKELGYEKAKDGDTRSEAR